MVAKPERFAMRMTEEERRMLTQLAARDAMNESDCVRLLIRHAYTAAFGAIQPPKPKRSKR
jgi:hypothetical protein